MQDGDTHEEVTLSSSFSSEPPLSPGSNNETEDAGGNVNGLKVIGILPGLGVYHSDSDSSSNDSSSSNFTSSSPSIDPCPSQSSHTKLQIQQYLKKLKKALQWLVRERVHCFIRNWKKNASLKILWNWSDKCYNKACVFQKICFSWLQVIWHVCV